VSGGDFLPEGTLRGLPGPLPKGERLLWQGAPTTAGIFVRVFHARLVALWFCAWGVVFMAGTGSPAKAVMTGGAVLLAGAAGLGLLWVLSWLTHRTSVYTITDRRVVLHTGIALPVTRNLPFAQIESGALRAFTDESGDIPLRLRPGLRIAYLQLWPHVRPWHVSRTEPMLRSVPQAESVVRLLAQALSAYAEEAAPVIPVVVARPAQTAPRLVAAE
jgi:hypothetical protein